LTQSTDRRDCNAPRINKKAKKRPVCSQLSINMALSRPKPAIDAKRRRTFESPNFNGVAFGFKLGDLVKDRSIV